MLKHQITHRLARRRHLKVPAYVLVGQGVLVALPAASRQHASYTKPELLAVPVDSLSLGLNNETKKSNKLF